MAPPSYQNSDANTAVLVERIDNLTTFMTDKMQRLETLVTQLGERLAEHERHEIGAEAVTNHTIKAAHDRLDNIEKDGGKLPKLEVRIEKLERFLPIIQGLAWVAPVLAISIAGLLWAIFTGDVQLVRP